jgi:single-stranded-DNA-specific exonuclease
VTPAAAADVPALDPRAADWILPEVNQAAVHALAQHAGLSPTIAQLLLARGIRTREEAAAFLAPSLDLLLDPYTMHGMADAVARIQHAIRNGQSILIYGDYDVDGTIAIVLLKTAIELLGGTVRYHIPHRLRDGYGMQAEILTRAATDGVQLVISVDTGIRAFAAAEEAARLNLDLIVTDHHLPEMAQGLPQALAILNPNQPGCAYTCKHLCGAGVAFKLSQALLEAHDRNRARGKLLPSFLRMLVIATVADAVPLSGENRVIASLGIAELERLVNPGLRALMEVAQLDPAKRRLSAMQIAFRIAPRINAAGRMDVASDVVELFTTRDPVRARALAEKLDLLNSERRQTEDTALAEIDLQLRDDLSFANASCIVLDGRGWHRGVVGILASRVVDRTGRPALVISHGAHGTGEHEDGQAHGSGRSIHGFHLLDAIASCHDLFTRFGGHAHAVGFSLPSERVPELRSRLCAFASDLLTPELLARKLRCDVIIELDALTPQFHRALCQLEPFGMGNEEPLFVALGLTLEAPPMPIKERHLRLRVRSASGRVSFSALGWRMADRVRNLNLATGSTIDLAFRLRENEHPNFGGLELEIADLRLSASEG